MSELEQKCLGWLGGRGSEDPTSKGKPSCRKYLTAVLAQQLQFLPGPLALPLLRSHASAPLCLGFTSSFMIHKSRDRPTLLGCTARLRFSIHLSRSAADRQEKHLLPDDVVTCQTRWC